MRHETFRTSHRATALLLAAAILTGGCSDPTALNTTLGAALGGAGGAGVGALVGPKGKKGESALIGAAVGAAAGGVVGYAVGRSVAREKKKYANDEAFLQRQVEQAQGDVRKARDRNDALRAEIDSLRAEFDATRASARREQLRATANGRVAALDEQSKKLEERVNFYRESAKQVDAVKNADAVAKLKQEVSDLEAQDRTLRARRESFARIVDGQIQGT